MVVFSTVEPWITSLVEWLRLIVETIGALIVAAGVGMVVYRFASALLRRREVEYNRIRLVLARYLALALEFQLGADILSTAIAPGWEEIGKLGAVAVIRTGLNYFLMKEMEHERRNEPNNAKRKGASVE